jgi:hypothetical protein
VRRLDALNVIWSIGGADLEGAAAVTRWYDSREEVLVLTAEVVLVASKFVAEVGVRKKDLGTGGYL